MSQSPLDILINLEIESKGFYTKPLGFMYNRFSECSDLEEQIRVYRTPNNTWHVLEGIFKIDDDEPGDHSKWFTLKEHNIQSNELLEIFLSSKKSIY